MRENGLFRGDPALLALLQNGASWSTGEAGAEYHKAKFARLSTPSRSNSSTTLRPSTHRFRGSSISFTPRSPILWRMILICPISPQP